MTIAPVAIDPYTTRGVIPACPLEGRGKEEAGPTVEAKRTVVERQLTIMNKVGLHARPAALFVQTAARFKDTRIGVSKSGEVRDAKSILSVLTLGVSQGTTITVRAEGPQAEAAIAALAALVGRDFGE